MVGWTIGDGAARAGDGMYIWELDSWPRLTWDAARLTPILDAVESERLALAATLSSVPDYVRAEVEERAFVSEALKTSLIEGEHLDPSSVTDAVRARLGIEGGRRGNPQIEGVLDMLFDIALHPAGDLDAARLGAWQAGLFPGGRSGLEAIDVGAWRRDLHGRMQVVSGDARGWKVHYVAPPAERLDGEMTAFLEWFRTSRGSLNPVVRAGLAHLRFVMIHPFDDGNGRVGRAVADLAAADAAGSDRRWHSVSWAIERERRSYYDVLDRAGKGGSTDVTEWLAWFCDRWHAALAEARRTADFVIAGALVLERIAREGIDLSARQLKIVARLIDDFDGNLTAKRYANIAKCSPEEAAKDIEDLLSKGLFISDPVTGRNPSFSLAFDRPISRPYPGR
jgi:Fic family protein